jgi:hypothetical protein
MGLLPRWNRRMDENEKRVCSILSLQYAAEICVIVIPFHDQYSQKSLFRFCCRAWCLCMGKKKAE